MLERAEGVLVGVAHLAALLGAPVPDLLLSAQRRRLELMPTVVSGLVAIPLAGDLRLVFPPWSAMLNGPFPMLPHPSVFERSPMLT